MTTWPTGLLTQYGVLACHVAAPSYRFHYFNPCWLGNGTLIYTSLWNLVLEAFSLKKKHTGMSPATCWPFLFRTQCLPFKVPMNLVRNITYLWPGKYFAKQCDCLNEIKFNIFALIRVLFANIKTQRQTNKVQKIKTGNLMGHMMWNESVFISRSQWLLWEIKLLYGWIRVFQEMPSANWNDVYQLHLHER